MHYLCVKLKKVNDTEIDTILELCNEVGKLLNALITYLKKFEADKKQTKLENSQ